MGGLTEVVGVIGRLGVVVILELFWVLRLFEELVRDFELETLEVEDEEEFFMLLLDDTPVLVEEEDFDEIWLFVCC